MWENIYNNTINYPLIQAENFIFSPLNIVVFILIFILGRIALKYIKRSFKLLNLTDKELEIEGKKIAVWRLTKQVANLLILFFCIWSLKINNAHIDWSSILNYEFFRLTEEGAGGFHIAVYHLFVVVLVIFGSRLILSIISVYIVKAVSGLKNAEEGTTYIYLQLAKYFIYSIATLIILRSFGAFSMVYNILLVIGVGFALGAQFLIRDFFSGFSLLFEGRIKVGDVIEIENPHGGASRIATVQKISLRSSQVITTHNKILIIPNSALTHESVINWSLGDQLTRFKIQVTVAYGSDTEKVRDILMSCARNHPRVARTKEIQVWIQNFGDKGLEMELLFWANQSFYIEKYKSEIRFAIDHEFRKEGVQIPFPQRTIHMGNKD